MKKVSGLLIVALAFAAGVAWNAVVAKPKTEKVTVTPAMWEGVSPEAAFENLQEAALALAEDGSWENIHVGRVYLVSGDREKAEEIFDRYRGDEAVASDLVRIGRAYAEAGDWEQARAAFDRVVELKPNDEDWLIEIGAFYNLNGDRKRAEELFARGFSSAPKNLKNTLTAAGSYAGVAPRDR